MLKPFNKMKQAVKILKITATILGCIFFILLILALTPAPFYMHYALGTDPNKSDEEFTPEYVIMLGGGGMPSEDNLMRLYYTGQFANYFQTPVIIIHPDDSTSQDKMSQLLATYGITKDSITFLTEGANTRSQVLCLQERLPELINKKNLIITSPSHLTRSVKCFNKLGFTQIRGRQPLSQPLISICQ